MKLLFLFLSVIIATAAAAEPGADIFATNAPVLRIKLEISRANMNSLQNQPRTAVPATLREGDKVFNNVMVHVKGAAGSFRDIRNKPGLTLSFGKNEVDQRFHGLRKFHLNNSVQDPSYSTHNICSQMFHEAGVPSARITNARVWINGEDKGFYVLQEGYNKDFLQRYFQDTKGNFYDGGFLREITDELENDAGADRTDRSDLKALAAAARLGDPAQRWQALQKVLDMDRFANFMALEILLWDWDGYVMKHNNYRIYHDPTTDKMVFIPHGMDQMFWEPQAPVFRPPIEALVSRAVLQTPEGNQLYRERLRKMLETVYRLDVVTNRFDQLVKRNRAAVAELGRGEVEEYDGNVADVRRRMIERWRRAKDQIDNEPKPMDFSKPVFVKRWRQQIESGSSKLEQVEFDGRPTLHIVANGSTISSWRSNVMLEPGRYRFETMARSAKLVAQRTERGDGGGLRISGMMQPRRNKMEGDTPWTKLQFEFEVNGGSSEVVLVCELRANKGEIWFDANSLKLEKLR